MRVALVCFLLGILAPIVFSGTIYVPDRYPAIQDAINASSPGDTIVVRPGTYVGTIDFLGKAITVRSEYGASVTVIDGNQAGTVVSFKNNEAIDSVLEGFTVTNGDAIQGGGIYCWNSSPMIIGNIISGNIAGGGGGVCCVQYSYPTIANNIISGNTVRGSGGGGILCNSSGPYIVDNWISGNTVPSLSGGGGIELFYSYPGITRNVITGNKAAYGGGIACMVYSDPYITENIVTANTTDYEGGGIHCYGSSQPTIINNTISGNAAGSGGGLSADSAARATVVNTIIWNNSAATGPAIYIGGLNPSTITISHSDVQGGQAAVVLDAGSNLNWGAGMIDADPLFADPADGDSHLTWLSPCRDRGDNSSVVDQHDFEMDPRIAQGVVDMGSDEFYYHLYSVGDTRPGAPIAVKVVGIPGVPVRFALGQGVQIPPQPTIYGDLWLSLPFAQSWQLGVIPAAGLLVQPVLVPPGWASGSVHPFQALVGPWGGPATRLTNLMMVTVN